MRLCKLTTEQLRLHADNHRKLAQWLGSSRSVIAAAVAISSALDELIDRREASRPEELQELERSMAYVGACGYLNAEFPYATNEDGDIVFDWMEVKDYERGDDPEVDDCLRYLELRGLIERDPEHPTWIAIRGESEGLR